MTPGSYRERELPSRNPAIVDAEIPEEFASKSVQLVSEITSDDSAVDIKRRQSWFV
jgi:hypothetical protein